LKETIKCLDRELEQEPDRVQYELKEACKWLSEIDLKHSLLLNETEDKFLDWVVIAFENSTFQRILQKIELVEKLANKYLKEAPMETVRRHLKSTLKVNEIFRKQALKFQSKIMFYLPQAVMKREKQKGKEIT
jgi:hypothetical protein